MKEKELRLALVCYGGASLAVYMDGIVTEFLQAVRASAFRDIPTRVDAARPLTGSSLLYQKLLDRLDSHTRLSLIIDTIAGASAGGLNGIFLGRAIAHDLSLKPLRNMWLDLGDIEQLMANYSLAGPFNKLYLIPALWLFMRRIKGFDQFDDETKAKLMRFMRSRWFQPPFNGDTMLRWMVDAGLAMGRAKALGLDPGHASLMPTGHSLDLFVRLTNFDGEIRTIRLEEGSMPGGAAGVPSSVQEKAHGKHLHFRYRRRLSGDGVTDFHDDNIAALGFAARATSSYPGAFPPVSFRDLDRHLRGRDLSWPHRDAFMDHNFADQLSRPGGAEELHVMNFMDGGIVDNKPFGDAIKAIGRKAAQRPVDRRILFIDPMPADTIRRALPKRPGFFEAIFGAAMQIPLSQPIYSELESLEAHNQARTRESAIIRATQQDVSDLVADLFTLQDISNPADLGQGDVTLSADLLARGRVAGADLAYARSGFAVVAYHHARLSDTLDQISGLIHDIVSAQAITLSAGSVSRSVVLWAEARGLLASDALRLEAGVRLQQLLDFLKASDLTYRVRRIRRILRMVNAMGPSANPDLSDTQYRKLKRRIYLALDQAQQRAEVIKKPCSFLDGIVVDDCLSIDQVDSLVVRLQDRLKLEALDSEVDSYLSLVLNQISEKQARLDLFRAYVGFAFEDMMTFSNKRVMGNEDHPEVRVMRVSPVESRYLSGQANPLKGDNLRGFGAFFSRTARENDYLWGRLHGADRILDVIFDSVGPEGPTVLEKDAIKKEIFLAILEEEKKDLPRVSDLIDQLSQQFRAG